MTDERPIHERTGLPPSLTMPQQINHLLSKIARLEKQLAELREPTPEQTAEEKAAEREREKAQRQRERDEKNQADAERTILQARAAAIRALVKLLPRAVKQANAGKPALLRLILRSTR